MKKKSPPRSPNARPAEPTGAERRKFPRASVDCPVTLALAGGKAEAKLRDVGAAGVCFYLDRPLAEMTVLGLSMALGGKRIEARGAVVRCQRLSPVLEHYEIGVFFHEIGARERAAIEKFVAGIGVAQARDS